MIIGKVYSLDEYEQAIVKLSANQRHNNKVKTGWDGFKTVNKKSDVSLDVVGFGGEFIFARENNLFPDFKIHNTSKVLKTDDYDANWLGHSVDVKVNRKDHPLMVPEYAKTDCKIFALYTCNFPNYTFEGFILNNILFQKNNLRMTRVNAYVIEKKDLLNLNELIFLLNN
tara:strand:- start:1321 stop:1830 length:510 start_codon:yes stop_codon:yes gene_type:complete